MVDPSPQLGPLSEFADDVRLGQDGHPGGLSPVRLPHVRDQVARFIRDPSTPLAESAPAGVPTFDLVARHLEAAELYWVTPDMSALTVAAGAQLDTIRWSVADRPCDSGLIVFAGGIGMVEGSAEGTEVPVDAMTWGPSPDGLLVTMFCGRWRLGADVLEYQGPSPPLLIVGGEDFGGGEGELSVTDLPEDARTVVSALAAAWSLMGQPTIASRAEAR